MGRERKDFKRTSGVRDARLFVIATEGEKTEKHYFETLTDKEHFHSTRVHVEVLPARDGQSSPQQAIARMNAFKRDYKLRPGDELWIMVDRDHQSWGPKQLKEVQQLCKQKKYAFGLTNPCFEFWLLLHLEDANDYDEATRQKVLENQKSGSRTYCEQRIISRLGAYNKANPDFGQIIPQVGQALDRNKQLTDNGKVDLFSQLGTSIDRLIALLISDSTRP